MHTDQHRSEPSRSPSDLCQSVSICGQASVPRSGSTTRAPRFLLALTLLVSGSGLLAHSWRAARTPASSSASAAGGADIPSATSPGGADVPSASRAWAAALAQARDGQPARLADALEPIDAYFDQVALPGINAFLAEFSGPIDSTTFLWQSALDSAGRLARSDTDRVNRRTREALRTHLGLPDGLGRAIAASAERFDLLQTQLDNDLRPQLAAAIGWSAPDAAPAPGATSPPRGGATGATNPTVIDTRLASLQRAARDRARTTATEALLANSARDFAWRAAGKESLVLLLQTRIAWSVGSRLTSAVAARTGLLAAGASAAAATSAAGPPGWVIASGEIAAVVAADLTLSWLLERHAAGDLRAAINELREQAKGEVSAYLRSLDERTQRQRATLVLEAAKPNRGGA